MTTLPRLALADVPPRRTASEQDRTETPRDDAGEREWPALPRTRFRLSPLAVRIVLVNLAVVAVLVAAAQVWPVIGPSLEERRQAEVTTEARQVARVVAAAVALGESDAVSLARALDAAGPWPALAIHVFDAGGGLITHWPGTGITAGAAAAHIAADGGVPFPQAAGPEVDLTGFDLAQALRRAAQEGRTVTGRSRDPDGGEAILAVATPVRPGNPATEVVVVTAPASDTDGFGAQETVRRVLILSAALGLSVGLSLSLAASITNPLSALAAAAEQGRDRHARKMTRSRVRIPDLAARPDEIGRLSKALRGMVAALYDRIDANEQFAADVTHEIKNPLASLRAAVGTLRGARRADQRDRLLDVIEHDVRRLDRLVSDISHASRLDSDLVREESVRFNLLKTLTNLGDHMAAQATGSGVEFVADLPPEPILIDGLEGRLAQVFVNLLSNAMSFCEDGDAVRMWARRRDDRVLIVVEDTGPGIPESALGKVFDRFYSERPDLDFGNHSGLGLAISKQIVEAHGGVIWAENIRPTHADITSEPLGARFVVGLPV